MSSDDTIRTNDDGLPPTGVTMPKQGFGPSVNDDVDNDDSAMIQQWEELYQGSSRNSEMASKMCVLLALLDKKLFVGCILVELC